MNNPYQTPNSDVQVLTKPSKRWWKVFFWAYAALSILSTVMLVFDPEESVLEIIVEVVIYSTIFLGIFGYAYDKRIFVKSFWSFFMPVGIIYDIYGFYDLNLQYDSTEEMIFIVGLTFAIVLPLIYFQYLALFRYRSQSSEIWKS